MTALRRYASFAIVGIASLLLLAILASLLLIGAGFDADAGFPQQSVSPSITGIISAQITVLRTYLFRHALRNTLIVLAFTLPIALGLGLAGVALVHQSRRTNRAMAWLLLLPLAMPIALAMPAWRQIFAPTLALAGEDLWPSLLAVSFIQAWRILPFATLFLLLGWPIRWRSPAIGLTLSFGIYIVLSDVAVVLLLTGGSPFNGSHLLASWIYHTALAAGMPSQAASMSFVLITMLAVSVWGIVHFVGRMAAVTAKDAHRPAGSSRELQVEPVNQSSSQMISRLLAIVAMIALLLPLSVFLIKSARVVEWPGSLIQLLGQTDYAFWTANTILLACLTALATVFVAIPIGNQLAAWQSTWASRLSGLLGMLGMVALPLSFVPLASLQAEQHFGDGRWLLLLIFTSASICIGVWLVTLVFRANTLTRRRSLARPLMMLSFILVTHEMAAALALSNGRSQAQGLGSGIASRLAFDPAIAPTASGLAVLLPTVLLMLFYWRLLRGSMTGLIEVGGGGDSSQMDTDGNMMGHR